MKQKSNISNGEWKIMKLLWDNGEMTVTQFVTALSDDTAWNKNTIFTMLKRLEEKGFAKLVSEKRPQKYAAAITREKATNIATGSFVERVFDGNMKLFISAISGGSTLTKEEIDELRAMLDDAEKAVKEV